ncbi:acetolactate synthase, large subunit, biosynthetic type, partial [bacterium]
LKIILLNNHRLGMVRQLQEYYCGKRYIGVDFKKNPDFIKFAQAYDAVGIRVTNPGELRLALEQAKAAVEPVIVDCMIAPEENVLPMVKAGRPITDVFDGSEVK